MAARKVMMFVDATKCIGCKACQVACKQWHSLPVEATTFTGFYTNPPALSKDTLTYVKFHEHQPAGKKLQFLFFKKMCMHCNQARCMVRCPKGVTKESGGFVVFNDACIPKNVILKAKEKKALKIADSGDRTTAWKAIYSSWNDPIPQFTFPQPPLTDYSPEQITFLSNILTNKATGCLYGVPAFNGNKWVKCDFCFDRFEGETYAGYKNGQPTTACELTCPSGAIVTGNANDIMKTARARFTAARSQYPKSGLWGGRGRVIYLLAEAYENHGLGPKITF